MGGFRPDGLRGGAEGARGSESSEARLARSEVVAARPLPPDEATASQHLLARALPLTRMHARARTNSDERSCASRQPPGHRLCFPRGASTRRAGNRIGALSRRKGCWQKRFLSFWPGCIGATPPSGASIRPRHRFPIPARHARTPAAPTARPRAAPPRPRFRRRRRAGALMVPACRHRRTSGRAQRRRPGSLHKAGGRGQGRPRQRRRRSRGSRAEQPGRHHRRQWGQQQQRRLADPSLRGGGRAPAGCTGVRPHRPTRRGACVTA